MRLFLGFSALSLAACAPSAVSTGTYLARGDAALSRGDGAAAVGNYEAARKAGGAAEALPSKTADAATRWLEQEIERAQQRSPERGGDLLAAATAVDALAASYGVSGRIAGPLADLKKHGGDVLWREQKAQLVPCSERDPFTCQGQLLALLATLPVQASDARREVEAERAERNRVYIPRFFRGAGGE